jgi:hypothetical protein
LKRRQAKRVQYFDSQRLDAEIIAWRTEDDDALCADRPFFARLRGHRASQIQHRVVRREATRRIQAAHGSDRAGANNLVGTLAILKLRKKNFGFRLLASAFLLEQPRYAT